jgi:Xaa-Pro dipeptidase
LVEPIASKSVLRFSLGEYQARVAALKGELARRGIDILIGTVPEHFNYFTGFDPSGVFYYQQMFVTPDMEQPILLVHKVESELARTTSWVDDIRVWRHGEDPLQRTLSVLQELGLRSGMTIGLELDNWYLKTSTYLKLVDRLPDVAFVDATDIAMEMRVIKSPAEIGYMREAARLGDVGMAAAIDAIRPGVRERDVNAAIQSALYTAGSEYPAFPTIVAAGPRSGLFHGLPTDRVIEDGDPVKLEVAGVVARYNTNICRTVVAGRASQEVRELHEIVLTAYFKALDAIKPGVAIGELDRISKEARAGYEDYFPARSGFGLELAYPPVWIGALSVLEGDPHVLRPGMVFSVEPSIAMYHGMTVIFANDVLVTDAGAEVLHKTPSRLIEAA